MDSFRMKIKLTLAKVVPYNYIVPLMTKILLVIKPILWLQTDFQSTSSPSSRLNKNQMAGKYSYWVL
jgi:hypothetical protein